MVEIHAYSKAASGGKQLSAHFKVREFACGDGSDAVLVAPRLVMVLETIRAHFGVPVVIHSAYRTPQYNTKVDGVAHSQHCYGMAADISVKGQTPAEVAAFARTLMPDWGGVGVYDSFCHIDVREAKADWKGGPEDGNNIHAVNPRSASLETTWRKQTERSGRCCHPWPRPGRCRPSGW